jgi:hypothetical protein
MMALSRQCWLWRDVAIASCWRWSYQDDIGRGVMSLLGHVGDGTTESYWRWRYRGDVGYGMMSLPSMLVMA